MNDVPFYDPENPPGCDARVRLICGGCGEPREIVYKSKKQAMARCRSCRYLVVANVPIDGRLSCYTGSDDFHPYEQREVIIPTCGRCGKTRQIKFINGSGASDRCSDCSRELNPGPSGPPHNKRHGLSGTRIHDTWQHIRVRCSDRAVGNAKKNYFDRGIRVCKEWENRFESFYEWAMANGYSDDLQIDRKDNNGDYTPENCHWTTSRVNNRNKRNIKLNPDHVRAMRKASSEGRSMYRLAKDYGMSPAAAALAIKGKTWKDVL